MALTKRETRGCKPMYASILQLARSLGVCSKRLSCCEWAFGWAVASLSSGWLLSRGAAGAFCAERGGCRCRLRAG